MLPMPLWPQTRFTPMSSLVDRCTARVQVGSLVITKAQSAVAAPHFLIIQPATSVGIMGVCCSSDVRVMALGI